LMLPLPGYPPGCKMSLSHVVGIYRLLIKFRDFTPPPPPASVAHKLQVVASQKIITEMGEGFEAYFQILLFPCGLPGPQEGLREYSIAIGNLILKPIPPLCGCGFI